MWETSWPKRRCGQLLLSFAALHLVSAFWSNLFSNSFLLTSIYWPNRDYSEKFSVLMKIKLLCAHNWSRFWVDFRMVLLHMVLHLQAAPGMMTYWKLALTWLVLRIVHLYIRYMCLATLRLYTVSYIMPIISYWSFSVHWVAALLAAMTRWECSVRSRLLTTSECIL